MKKVLLGVTGGIAAYKACEIVRCLKRRHFSVRCVMTPSAAQFITRLSLSVLSGEPVHQNSYDPGIWEMEHLSLAAWADLVLIAPATADFIARLSQGRAEGLLDSLVLAARSPVAVCPAMDEQMWLHPATQDNVKRLRAFGYQIWGPEQGSLASGKSGLGRLMEAEKIAERVHGKLK